MLLIMRERMLALIGTFTNETPIVRELANWVTERPPHSGPSSREEAGGPPGLPSILIFLSPA